MPEKIEIDLKSDGILIILPIGSIRSEDFDKLAAVVDPWIETQQQLRGVLISIQKFPDWENASGFVHHIEFVKAHHRLDRRVALAVDGPLPEIPDIMTKLASHFVEAEIKQFPFDEEDMAIKWLKS